MSDDDLEAQGFQNWNSAVEAFRIINGRDVYNNFRQSSENLYQMDVEYQGQAYSIALSNNNNVWASLFSILLSEDWGADDALLAISVMSELPALGIAQIGPALCIRHTISLPSASVHAFTNGALMTAIGTARVVDAFRGQRLPNHRQNDSVPGGTMRPPVPAAASQPIGPGWYPDPGGAPGQRWWDGQQWTAHYQH